MKSKRALMLGHSDWDKCVVCGHYAFTFASTKNVWVWYRQGLCQVCQDKQSVTSKGKVEG